MEPVAGQWAEFSSLNHYSMRFVKSTGIVDTLETCICASSLSYLTQDILGTPPFFAHLAPTIFPRDHTLAPDSLMEFLTLQLQDWGSFSFIQLSISLAGGSAFILQVTHHLCCFQTFNLLLLRTQLQSVALKLACFYLAMFYPAFCAYRYFWTGIMGIYLAVSNIQHPK